MRYPLARILLTAGLSACVAAPAIAAPVETMTIKVRYDDIPLATPAGQKVLEQRIERAVRTVCRADGVTTGSRVLTEERRDCLAKARASAARQVAALQSDAKRGG